MTSEPASSHGMRAWLSHEPGDSSTLGLTACPTPEVGPNDLLIEVASIGLNWFDTLIIQDKYQQRPERPFAPGGEVAGTVTSVGAQVSNWQIGDKVVALPGHGGLSDTVVCDAAKCFAMPGNLSFESASALLIAFGTSFYALKSLAKIKAGETLLIIGASSGVGTAAIQIGKTLGAQVVAAITSPEKEEICRSQGADEVLHLPRKVAEDDIKPLSQDIKAFLANDERRNLDGVDVVYDALGGPYAEAALRALNWGGRFLVVGFTAGIPKLPLNLPLLKGLHVSGVHWGAFVEKEPVASQTLVAELLDLAANREIIPPITKMFPFEEANRALEALEKRSVSGKVVVSIAR